jgi:alkylation response protein AidB-like acyl-CoA dehydrogenase
MTYFPLTEEQRRWRGIAEALARDVLEPRAADTDREGRFPSEQLAALRAEGLMGLRGDREQGGAGEGLLTTCLVVEALAAACPSTALIYKMHLESIELVCRVPTPDQARQFVPRLVSGEWLSTVAGSEAGHRGGAWADAPKASVSRTDDGYEVRHIAKSFVTAAGLADSYFFMCSLEQPEGRPLQLMFQIRSDDLEWTIDRPWDGLGMRGNASSPMTFNGFIPDSRLLNPEARPVDFFPVVLATYAATYLGIAAGCFDRLVAHVAGSERAGGGRLSDLDPVRSRVAAAKVEIERSRALLYSACAAFDDGRHQSPLPFFESKVACDQLAASVASDAMTLGGGAAFAKQLPFERYFRDARAGMVMGVAHDVAVGNIGRLLFPPPRDKAEGGSPA